LRLYQRPLSVVCLHEEADYFSPTPLNRLPIPPWRMPFQARTPTATKEELRCP
jgi:hypothetical protein